MSSRNRLDRAEKELQALGLDPAVIDVDKLKACLASPASENLAMFPVSDLVNSARRGGPELVKLAGLRFWLHWSARCDYPGRDQPMQKECVITCLSRGSVIRQVLNSEPR